MISMKSKKEQLARSRLYAIVNEAPPGLKTGAKSRPAFSSNGLILRLRSGWFEGMVSVVEPKAAGLWRRDKQPLGTSGIDIVQLRDKTSDKAIIIRRARLLSKFLAARKILFIINDYIDVAKVVDCDGVHLGQSDLSLGIARCILGKDRIIGVSCHNLKQALMAQWQGADYIGIGPVFATPTKPEYPPIGLEVIKEVARDIRIPFFAIGGINKDNLREVLAAGAKRVALVRAIGQSLEIKEIIQDSEFKIR